MYGEQIARPASSRSPSHARSASATIYRLTSTSSSPSTTRRESLSLRTRHDHFQTARPGSYSPLSVDRYTSKSALDASWASGNWTYDTSTGQGPSPADQYLHSHRYIGTCILHALQSVGLIEPSQAWIDAGNTAMPLPEGDCKVLDACCVPGMIESLIHELKGETKIEILCADRDDAMLGEVRRKSKVGRWENVQVQNMDVQVSTVPAQSG